MSPSLSAAKLQLIPLAELHESPLNPRQHFDPTKLQALAESLGTHGQLTSILVRPNKKGYEIGAGHRRYRAAKMAGLTHLEAKVREMDDATFAEVLSIENDEREDVHPLEQAQGYRLLMEKAGYDVAKIAKRVQRSHDFVYDRLRLLQLTPELKALFLDDRFQLAHALILAKLSADEQAKTARRPIRSPNLYIRSSEGGLWRTVGDTLDPTVFPLVPRSPAELEAWIAKELRFKPEAVELEELFPNTAIALELAEETGARVVSITKESHLRPNAKDQKERTFTRDFWRRADGLEGSKDCEYAVVGVLVAGAGRGESMGVCLRRDKCLVHWRTSATAHQAKERAKKNGTAKVTATKVDPRKAARDRAAAVKARVAAAALAAGVAIINQALEQLAQHEPSVALVNQARKALTDNHDAVELSLAEFVVWLAVQEIEVSEWGMGINWKRKGIVADCLNLGVDVVKILKGITINHCKFCGCSENDPCDPACTWVSTTPLVCSNPVCVALHEGKPVPASTNTPDDEGDEDTGVDYDDEDDDA